MKNTTLVMMLAGILVTLLCAESGQAIVDPDNKGQWAKPTNKGPDKEVPGFLVNLGPTGARGWMWGMRLRTDFARQILITKVDAGSPADGMLQVDDVILGINGGKFAR